MLNQESPKLDMLMVLYRSGRFQAQAIDSVIRTIDVNYQLTIIDNEKANQPLTKIWNQFARQHSDGDFICYLNPDIICAKNWASRLLNSFTDKDVVIASPCTPSAGGSRLQQLPSVPIDQLDELAEIQPAEVLEDPDCVGYCYCIRTEWFKQVGYFDTDPALDFYGQETELNYRAVDAGRKVVCVRNSIVYHFGHGSTGGKRTPELQAKLYNTFDYLRAKYPIRAHLIGS